MESTKHIVSIRHRVAFVESKTGGTAKGVVGSRKDVGLAGGDDGFGGEGERGGVVGEMMRRQECLRHLLATETVVGEVSKARPL